MPDEPAVPPEPEASDAAAPVTPRESLRPPPRVSIPSMLLDGPLVELIEEGPRTPTPRPPPVPERPRMSMLPTPAAGVDPSRALEELFATTRLRGDKRYQLIREVDRGGVGRVTAMYDRVLRHRVARKTLLDEVRGQPVLVWGFLREAQITAWLDHPSIVPVHDLGVDDQGRPCFTMKFVEGKTLLDLIERRDGDPSERLREVLEALVRVCDALSFAHSRGVVHCDVKPRNIMVGDYGEVYLMDWGFARVREDSVDHGDLADGPLPEPTNTPEDLVRGTPGYMPPEQALARQDDIEARSDVFAVGAVLFHALTGRAPYNAPGMAANVMAAQRCAHPSVDEAAGEGRVPAELARIVERAMQPALADRYPTMDAMRRDLVNFLRGSAAFRARRVAAGEYVIREGEEGDEAYLVTAGELEVTKMHEGAPLSLRKLGPGDCFGEMSLLAPAPRTASVMALTEVTLVVLTRDTVEEELASMKPWMGLFVRHLSARFRELQEERLRDEKKAVVRPWWRLW